MSSSPVLVTSPEKRVISLSYRGSGGPSYLDVVPGPNTVPAETWDAIVAEKANAGWIRKFTIGAQRVPAHVPTKGKSAKEEAGDADPKATPLEQQLAAQRAGAAKPSAPKA